MSYVDLNSNVRWKEADHVARIEEGVRSSVTHVREHVLLRRSISFMFYMLAQMLPDGTPTKPLLASFGQPLSAAALAELTAAAAVFAQADTDAIEARADSARLDLALDYEEAEVALALIVEQPYPPRSDYTEGPDGDEAYAQACAAIDAINAVGADERAAKRAPLQAVLDAATQDTLDLVAWRAGNRAPQQPQEIQA